MGPVVSVSSARAVALASEFSALLPESGTLFLLTLDSCCSPYGNCGSGPDYCGTDGGGSATPDGSCGPDHGGTTCTNPSFGDCCSSKS